MLVVGFNLKCLSATVSDL